MIKKLNESELGVQPKNNIVCVQCLFRNLLTDKQFDFSSDVVSTRMRRGLDFELYYQLDGETVEQLLATTLLATNCRNSGGLVRMRPMTDILSKFEPFDCFLTDSAGERITGDEMSEKSASILRRRNAQQPNFSIYRFSFFAAGYSVAACQLYTGEDGAVLPAGYVTRLNPATHKPVGLTLPSGEFVGVESLTSLKPFMLSGYWTKFAFDPAAQAFTKERDVAGPFVPALKARWGANATGMFRTVVKTADDVDWSPFSGFLETAMSKAILGGNDMRTKGQAERAPRRRAPKTVTRMVR